MNDRRDDRGRPPARAGAPSSRPGPGRGPRDGPPRDKRPTLPPSAIMYEDAEVLVVDKPPGLLSARMPGDDRDSLFDLVKLHVRGKQKRPVRVWIIHRLDKEASGLLVFAKTEKAFNWLKEDLRAKRMHRMYLAVVEGEIGAEGETASQREGGDAGAKPRFKQLPSGTIQSFMRDDEFGNVTSVGVGDVARESARGRRDQRPPPPGPRPFRPPPGSRFMSPPDADAPRLAVTHWRMLGAGRGRSLLQVRLETGRKNQIRVHMKEFKHPIVGDARYGATTDPIGRMALHASELGFTHPGTGQSVRYSSPAPASFYNAVGMEPVKPAEPAASAPIQAPVTLKKDQPARSDAGPGAATSWDNVAHWYDQLIEEDRSDHFRHVIMPGSLRLLRPEVRPTPMRVLDIACGQGSLCRRLAEMGLETVGVDAAPRLIDAARAHARSIPGTRFEVADARALGELPKDITDRPFDAAACIMALMNMDPLEPVIRGAAELLQPGGAFVAVILHPAFRAPGQTSWGWDAPDDRSERGRGPRRDDPRVHQYRRVDGYLSPGQMPITMNPGYAAHGAEPVQTWTFHRPVQTYVRALADAGLLIEALEEWPSMRRSQPGPRAAEEDRARREIPMFLGIRAVKQP